MVILIVKVIIPTILIGSIYCSEYYVASFGSDSYPGTFEQPFRTIQRAANNMIAGDSFLIVGRALKAQLFEQNIILSDFT